jgi:hypothetical protein
MSTLPNLAKTWQFDVNQEIPWQGTTARMGAQILFLLKESLRAFVLAPWTVKGSSNGVTAGMDTVDRWLSRSNITWAADGVARSWIVLQQTGLIGVGNPPTTGFQVLLDCSTTVSSAGVSCRSLISPTGSFTGGSTTARPTAVDEQAVNGVNRTHQQYLWNNGSQVGATRLHVMQSSDGQCTRWLTYNTSTNGPTIGGVALYERISNPTPGLLYPAVAMGYTNLNRDNMFTRQAGIEPFVGNQGGGSATQFFASMSCEGSYDALLPYREFGPDELSDEWAMHPCGLWIPNTTGFRARIGEFFDLWTTSYKLMDGTCFPEDGSREFVKFGSLVFPWNGEAPSLG